AGMPPRTCRLGTFIAASLRRSVQRCYFSWPARPRKHCLQLPSLKPWGQHLCRGPRRCALRQLQSRIQPLPALHPGLRGLPRPPAAACDLRRRCCSAALHGCMDVKVHPQFCGGIELPAGTSGTDALAEPADLLAAPPNSEQVLQLVLGDDDSGRGYPHDALPASSDELPPDGGDRRGRAVARPLDLPLRGFWLPPRRAALPGADPPSQRGERFPAACSGAERGHSAVLHLLGGSLHVLLLRRRH
ncbi:unnamed protein product, partial [Symbiodinium microadriaticum]